MSTIYLDSLELLTYWFTDIDECQNGDAGCEEGCANSDPGFTCTCPPGKELNEDGVSCDGMLFKIL